MTPPLSGPDAVSDPGASQRAAAQPDHSAWVIANAGSGKTKVLIDRVARLLLAGAEPDSILCVTYTNAAASEMQARLFDRLGAWCVMDRNTLALELAQLQAPDLDSGTLDDAFLGRARELFARALETPGGLRIETIHAFCGRVLRRFPLEAGVPPGFNELDEVEADALLQLSQGRLGNRVREGDAHLLAAIHAASADGDAPAPVLEGLRKQRPRIEGFLRRFPVDGRAEQELKRLLRAPDQTRDQLLERAMGEDLPRADLERAADAFGDGDKVDTLRVVLSGAPADERLATYRSLMFTIKGDLKKQSSVITQAQQKKHPFLLDLFSVDVPQGREVQRLLDLDAAMKARRIHQRSAALIQLGAVLFEGYDHARRARAALDFDDLIDRVGALLSNPSAADWVLWKLDGGIAHILIDEAQDTSPRQWGILNQLGAEIFSGQGAERDRPRTWFVVGDQKQSIYSFQGADPEHFLKEAQDFTRRAHQGMVAHVRPVLSASFRSTPEVLGFVDAVFDPEAYGDRAPFSILPPADADQPRHVAHRKGEHGAVEVWPVEPPLPKTEPDPWDAPRIQQSEPGPRARLAKRIAQRIREEVDAGHAVWDRGKLRPVQPGDYLILVRGRGGGLFDALLRFLKQQGLPVAGADRIQLLDSLAVQDLLNLMRFAQFPGDDLVLAEILKGPLGGCTDEDLIALCEHRTGSLWRQVESAGARYDRVRRRLRDILDSRGLPPIDFLLRQLERPIAGGAPGWEAMLSRFGSPAREPITALLDRAAAFDSYAAPSLELFLHAIEQQGGEVKRELSGASDSVRVMTVHGAKGLEAPIVFLPDTTADLRKDTSGVLLSENGAPLWVGAAKHDTPLTATLRQEADSRALREHRRLLYVALTRARDRLVVCGAATRKSKEGYNADSWYALCQRAMNRLAEAGSASGPDEFGILRVGETLAAPAAARASTSAAPSGPSWLDQMAAPTAMTSRILAPSALSGDEPPVLAPFGVQRQTRLRRGRLIHRLLQHLPAIPEPDRPDAARRMLAHARDLPEADREEMCAAALSLMADPQCWPLFAASGRAEAPVIGRLGANIINGRVDRLAVTDTEVLIIDYKTDRPAPRDISGVGMAYVRQMAAYRAILSESWPGRRVRCLLAWTDGPVVMELPEARLLSSLDGLQ